MKMLSYSSAADMRRSGFSSMISSNDQQYLAALSDGQRNNLFASFVTPPAHRSAVRDDLESILSPAPLKSLTRQQSSLLMTGGSMRSDLRGLVGGLPAMLTGHGSSTSQLSSSIAESRTATGFVRNFVSHEYTDRAATSSPLTAEVQERPQQRRKKTKKRRGPASSFPKALHVMLTASDDEKEGFAHIVSWQPHGRAFRVHDQPAFVSQIMPRFLPRQTRWESFIRMLNLYGLKRLTRPGPDQGCYYHDCLLRGKPELLEEASFRRQRVKGSKVRPASSPQAEPNFYAMEPVENKKPAAVIHHNSPPSTTAVLPPPPHLWHMESLVQQPGTFQPLCHDNDFASAAAVTAAPANLKLHQLVVDHTSPQFKAPVNNDDDDNLSMTFDEHAAMVGFMSDVELEENFQKELVGCSNWEAI